MTLIINGKTYEAGELIAYVENLEKENAELKGINTHTLSQLNLDNGELITKLTKAKEYIKLLLMDCVGVYESTGKTIAEIQAEADQFLKESEE